MNSSSKKVPKSWKLVVNEEMMARSITRLSYEILEKKREISSLAVVGIRTGGEHIGRRVQKKIQEIEKTEIPFGIIDITLYRDDLSQISSQPLLRGTELPFKIAGSRIILVDDVLYTGRTIRAALDAIIDFGRPACVELAVLTDRGHREFPIRADFVGKNLPTKKDEFVEVKLVEEGFADGIYVISGKDAADRE